MILFGSLITSQLSIIKNPVRSIELIENKVKIPIEQAWKKIIFYPWIAVEDMLTRVELTKINYAIKLRNKCMKV